MEMNTKEHGIMIWDVETCQGMGVCVRLVYVARKRSE